MTSNIPPASSIALFAPSKAFAIIEADAPMLINTDEKPKTNNIELKKVCNKIFLRAFKSDNSFNDIPVIKEM